MYDIISNNYFEKVIISIERAQKKAIAKEEPRRYIGASGLGEECERKIQYNFTSPEKKSLPEPRMVRIWKLGDLIETYLEKLIRDARFDLVTEDDLGNQFGFKLADGAIQGHVDGILRDGPKIMEYPALLELKSAKDSSFKKFVKHGLANQSAQYYAQVQTYQRCMGLLNPALWIVMNKDTSEIYAELVTHNPSFASSLIDKAERILEASKKGFILPREYNDKNNWHCKYCDFKDECWGEETETPEWAD